MASRKLARDLFLSKHLLFRHQLLISQQVSSRRTRIPAVPPNGYSSRREFGVFNEFSKKIKGEVERNQDFQQSIKEIKEKAEGLKGVKDDLKVRTKQTTEQLYKHVDGVWTEAEAKAKKVYADVEEKISAAKEEVKESFGVGKQEPTGHNGTSASHNTNGEDGSKTASGEEKQQGQQQSESSDNAQRLFSKVKFGASSISPKVSSAFHKLKEAKPVDLVKKGIDIVKEELKGNPNRRKHLEYDASSATSPNIERSSQTDIVVLPSKQSPWSKKWEAFKNKIAEDMRERWETSDHPVVHKIQETFSLPEFVAEVQEVVKPVLNAYFKFQTQQVYCVRDRLGSITEGGQDTIHTVYYAWAMQQLDPEEVGEGRSNAATITCNAQPAPAAVNLAPGTPVRPTSILVVGATGTLGRQIVRRALDEGYDVRCLVRPRPAPADFLRDWGATVVNADLSKPETIPATLVGVHTVIDCATGRPEEPIKTVDWEGKVALIQCAKAMGIQKFVFFSIHNCDKHPEVPLMEIKYCTEKFLRDAGLNHIVIRLCGFMQGLIGQYAVPILEEKSVWGTDAPTRIAYMDTQDIARLTFIALRNENINGKLLTFAGPRAWTTQEVITLCERLAGQDANVTTVPVSVLRFTRQLTCLFEWTSDVADRLAFSEVLTSDTVFSVPMAETYNLLGVDAKDISSLEKYLQDYFTNILKKLKDIKAQSKQTDIYF
ncbi:UNVERIFIED_CONTAM: protein high chlorophyll fluorescence phenotype, chloroplastic [Sesamum radiatum]|uniref:Protein high chlorophyll fluorescence phenotype, chloroplastic n=1 Tax=Sesamum radiatum TaxID=300843 RepID=A0AAW2MTS9_SESRA